MSRELSAVYPDFGNRFREVADPWYLKVWHAIARASRAVVDCVSTVTHEAMTAGTAVCGRKYGPAVGFVGLVVGLATIAIVATIQLEKLIA